VVLNFVVGSLGIVFQLWFGVVIAWSTWLLFYLMRWLNSDKDRRPRMRFPKKTAGLLFLVIMAVGYFVYLIARDLEAA